MTLNNNSINMFADVLAPLAQRLGVSNISALPGCWEVQVDPRWYFAVNPHLEPVICSEGVTVEPGFAYVQFNGFPAGVVGIDGEGTFAAGDEANLQAFKAACEAMP